jgi:predicted acetyltransferase
LPFLASQSVPTAGKISCPLPMTSQFKFCTSSTSEQLQRLEEITRQCFNESSSSWSSYYQNVGQENFRCLQRAGEVVGSLAIYPIAQWFGGQCIPMAGLASVGVPPEHRGTGVAVEMLTQTLRELHQNGVPLSTLYAATQRPYRKVGYEQAGTRCLWKLPLDSILMRSRTLPVRAVPRQAEVFADLYQKAASQTNGKLERNAALWTQVLQPQRAEVYAYTIGSETQLVGYVIFKQQQTSTGYDLVVQDYVVLTPAAEQQLWTFFADHRSIAQSVLWRGPSVDPLLLQLPEQTSTVQHVERWLLRVVDVPKALEKRGYPVGVDAELHLNIQDDLLPENTGKFVLTVSGGSGEVTRGGRGDLQLNIGGLAPLYTGLFTPEQLKTAGLLASTDAALVAATQLFSGSEPWMSEHF